MGSTALATEMTTAIRDFGTGVETHGRALRSSVLQLVSSSSVGESSRARIARDIEVPTTQVLGWIASALRMSSTFFDLESHGSDRVRRKNGFVIVDRHLTRC